MESPGHGILARCGNSPFGGLADRLNAQPSQLSGGEQQRVAIAGAVHQPRLLLCDEPTSNIDARTGRSIMKLIRDVAVQPGRVAIVVTHDPRVLEFGDRIISMDDGQIQSQETSPSDLRELRDHFGSLPSR